MARLGALPLALLLTLAACGGDDDTTGPSAEADEVSFRERMTTIDDAVTVWAGADSIDGAHAAAEAAANLVVGSNGPDYGDRDGNGTIDGEATVGVLPGLDGSPAGVADPLGANACVAADVLGGDWSDPGARWDTMITTIDAWSPDDNTMPSLPSHPMRIVGWATLALATDSLDEAHEYAGHAELHVDVSLEALDC